MARAGQIMRPAVFNINHFAPLGRGLVFAGLGCGPGAVQFNDSSINGNHGTLTSMDPATDWVDTSIGRKALQFDGSAQYVDLDFSISNATFTFAAWAVDFTGRNGSVFGDDSATPYKSLLISLAEGSGFTCFVGDGASYENVAFVWPGDQYAVLHHYCVTRQSSASPKLYIDGVQVGATGTAVRTGSVACRVCPSAYRPFDGRITDPCIWNRALSENEIAALADPSNTLLEVGGQPLIWTPRAMSYFYAKAPAAGGATPWLYRPINSQTIGVCA